MKLKDRIETEVRKLCLNYSVKEFDGKTFNHHFNKLTKNAPGVHEGNLTFALYDFMPLKQKMYNSVVNQILENTTESIKSKSIKL